MYVCIYRPSRKVWDSHQWSDRAKSSVSWRGPRAPLGRRAPSAMLVLPTRQCASRPVPPLTSPFIILYVSKRCGGRNRVKMVNSCGRFGFCGVTTSRNGSQRVATGRNGCQRAGFYLRSLSRGESQRGSTEVNVLGFPAKSEPRQVATIRSGS